MSDDEYYEDDDDWYWYEEDCMGIGDDLAETAVHSPIMVEDPSLEVVDTFSDWEYYSDDYYDDDPTIIKKTRADLDGPRKKKRKLSALEDIPNLSLGPTIVDSATDSDSFRGVLWKSSATGEEVTLYEPGKGEKVALLSDWREIFKTKLYRKDWFQNGDYAEESSFAEDIQQPDHVLLRESTPEGRETQAVIGDDEHGGTYSPPPLVIEDMNKSINRRKGQAVKHELEKPQSNLRKVMVVEDSEEELADADDTSLEQLHADFGDGMMVIDNREGEPDDLSNRAANPEDVGNMNQETQKDEPSAHGRVLRVEVPALSKISATKAPVSTTKRTKGKSSPVTEITNPKPAKRIRTSQNNTLIPSPTDDGVTDRKVAGQKRKSAGDVDSNDQSDRKRRSRRIVSTSSNSSVKLSEENKRDQKRIRAASPSSTKGKRGKKKNA
ncbi:hypothetical protein BGW36DRAFT_355901 [Talaromyces proteolyticus]|uniref:Uncharacterized protein n=1 Tax=Talaromyces proteolyticus TaxID=1131652 RepID=A0AAD4L0R1_9EURO|nr:uncharacterized protein BGW36DRAFT_355901 [Talaromyces proteolyticus]KAH8701745.1 hypothetical protein BGW36DRAFT_355901 [Talaromyces proteolyticus]